MGCNFLSLPEIPAYGNKVLIWWCITITKHPKHSPFYSQPKSQDTHRHPFTIEVPWCLKIFLSAIWRWYLGPDSMKRSSYKYRKSHCGDKMVVRSSYLHYGISYTGKMTSLYWISPLIITNVLQIISRHYFEESMFDKMFPSQLGRWGFPNRFGILRLQVQCSSCIWTD